MGVRESAENMEGELNLHDLVTESEKRPEVIFDPERDLTEEDWEAMIRDLVALYGDCNDTESVSLSAEQKARVEKIFFHYFLKLKIVSEERINDWLSKDSGMVWWDTAIKKQTIEKQQGKIKERYDAMRSSFFTPLEIASMQYPVMRKRLEKFQKGEKTRQEVIDQLNQYRDDWQNFSQMAMAMRFVGFKKEELGLDDEAWEGMKKTLGTISGKSLSHQDVSNKIELLFAMKVLSAHKVEATDKGLEIEMVPPEDFKEKVPDRPERRKF